nr:unnamed protein product [Digitaria exilis]
MSKSMIQIREAVVQAISSRSAWVAVKLANWSTGLVSIELKGYIEWRGEAVGAMVSVGERDEEGLLEVGGRAEERLPNWGNLLIEPRQYLSRAD